MYLCAIGEAETCLGPKHVSNQFEALLSELQVRQIVLVGGIFANLPSVKLKCVYVCLQPVWSHQTLIQRTQQGS